MSEKYIVENPRVIKQIKYAESLMERQFSDWEKQIFEWAYVQGREDAKEER